MLETVSKSDSVITDKIKICALMLDPYDKTPGQRFRIEQWEPYLKKSNILIDYFSFTDDNLREVLYKPNHHLAKIKGLSKAYLRRAGQILSASNYDLVFLYRTASMIGPAIFEKWLNWRDYPIIFDFDDSIYLHNTSDANEKFGWLKFSGKTAKICRLSTSITVGNSHLYNYARQYNDNVYIVPTSIDTKRYQPSPKSEKTGPVIIGWTGSSTSQYHLEAFEPVLAELVKRRGKDIEIRVVSNREPSFTKVPYVWRSWSAEGEVDEISQIDIGIMPTPDDEWSRGKCALKALQYMSLGIPAICTDMGANRDVIRQGENGFLAKTPEDWLKYFDMLIDDTQLRAKLGRKARETVVENYSMEKCAELFAEVVRKTAKKGLRQEKLKLENG